MSATPEVPKSTATVAPKEQPKADAAIAKHAEATHAAVAEAAKPAKPTKEVLVEFQGAKDAAARKAVIEHLHLSPEEAKDAALQKSFKDAAHGDHDVEAAIDKKFHDAAHAKAEPAPAHAAPEAHKKEETKAHAVEHAAAEAHPKGHPAEHGEGAHAPDAAGHAEGAHAAPAHAAGHGHGHDEDKPGLTKRFLKNTLWELPKSLIQPAKFGAQSAWEVAKGGWGMFRGLFSKKYREETYSNPPVPLKAGKAANDNKEVHHEKHAA